MDTSVSEADLQAFMGMLPPAPHMRVADFTAGGPALDAGQVERTETIYERVTGRRPSITLDRAQPDPTAFDEGELNGIWCGRARPFPAPEDARTALYGFHRALMRHGALHLELDRPRWEGGDTAEKFLGILAETGFHPEQVDCGPARIRVLAMKKWRCCDDGPRRYYDTHAVQ